MKLSFQQIKDLIYQALPNCYLIDLYDDRFIYEEPVSAPGPGTKYKYYEVGYSIIDGKLTLGEKTEVEKKVEYVKVQAAMSLLAAAETPEGEDPGYKWRVRIIKYGLGADGRINWTRDPLVAALDKFNGARVFALNASQHQEKPGRFGKSVREIVGWIENAIDTGEAIEGDFQVLKAAKWLRDMVVDAFERGKPDLLGFSVDVAATKKQALVAGRQVVEPVRVASVEVDVVYEPTNDGKFIQMVAAVENEADQKEDPMFKKFLASMKQQFPRLTAAIEALEAKGDAVTQEDIDALLASIPARSAEAGPQSDEEGKDILHQTKLVACSIMLDRELGNSGLPAHSQERLRKLFAEKVFETGTLTAAIKDEKEYLDKITGSGRPADVGSGRAEVVGEPTRLQAAMDRMFGVRVGNEVSDVAPFESIRAAYVRLTGDTEVRGYTDASERLTAAFTSTTFAYVLGNSLYRRMVQDYKEVGDYGASRLISNKRNAKDFRTLEAVRIAYFGDLPDITPETIDYPDLGTLSDEEVTYALNQKGGTITITRKMIINDDMDAVNKIVNRLPRAARRTLAKRIWNKFISNATYKGDAAAIFHASHNNLGSAALSVTSLVAAKKAMANQTELGSNEKLMLRPVTLAIPTDLWDVAVKINRTQGDPGTANFGNPMYQFFGADDSGIFECPFMTDVTDWMLFADPREVEIIEVAFLNGQEEPEMFVANNPAVGQFFVADKIQYKVRHEYEAEATDFRGGYKAVVAG